MTSVLTVNTKRSVPRVACAFLTAAFFCWALLADEPEWTPQYVGLVMLVAAVAGLGAVFVERRHNRRRIIAGAVCCALSGLVGAVVLANDAAPRATAGILLTALANLAIFAVQPVSESPQAPPDHA